MKYRLLREGDTVQEDDEILQSDTAIWLKVSRGLFGEKYYSTDFNPMRRPIEGEPAPEQKGLPVRIAVVVNPETGEWNSAGWGNRYLGKDDCFFAGIAIDRSDIKEENAQVYWVTAVIPITEPPVIVGTVTEGE